MISGRTRLVALLGHPVAHSLSPRMQNAAFAALALDFAYVALDVPPERLEEAVHGLVALGFAGANVTAPHKLAVATLVETDAPSVNTLVLGDGRVAGLVDGRGHSRGAAQRAACDRRRRRRRRPRSGRRCRTRRVFSRRGEWPPDVGGADLVVHATSARDEVLFRLEPGQTLVELQYPDSATARRRRGRTARPSSAGSKCSLRRERRRSSSGQACPRPST